MIESKPVVRRGIAGIQRDRTPESLLALGPFPLVKRSDEGKRSLGLSQHRIELQSLECGLFGVRQRLVRTHQPIVGEKRIGVGKARISRSGIRIGLNGLFEVTNASIEPFAGPFIPVKSALQIKVVGFHIAHLSGLPFLADQICFQRADDG